MAPDTKQLLDFIANVGIPGGLLVILLLAFIIALPSLIRYWKAQAEQSRLLAAAIPRMEDSPLRMANTNDLLNTRLDALLRTMDQRLDVMNDRLEEIHRLVSKER